jgi:amino-acid N-acetyltransferase
VIPPLGCDGEGRTYRLNSDAVAVEVAKALKAAKLIYLAPMEGVRVRRPDGDEEELLRQVSVEEAEAIIKKRRSDVNPAARSKLEHAVKATRGGVPRVHIIDGRVNEGLLAEVFSNEGIGTLVHANEYQAVRQAHKKDARAIYAMIQPSMENDELMRRSRTEIERQIEDYYVFEIDRNPVACAAIHFYATGGEAPKAELACVCVDPKYENQGIGLKLMHFAEDQARAAGAQELFCLSTQAFNYFVQKGGFRLGTPEDLPPTRRTLYERSGRRSQVLVKRL